MILSTAEIKQNLFQKLEFVIGAARKPKHTVAAGPTIAIRTGIVVGNHLLFPRTPSHISPNTCIVAIKTVDRSEPSHSHFQPRSHLTNDLNRSPRLNLPLSTSTGNDVRRIWFGAHIPILVHVVEMSGVNPNSSGAMDRKTDKWILNENLPFLAGPDKIHHLSGGSEHLSGTIPPEFFRNLVLVGWKCWLIAWSFRPVTS
jgi:hypothetical protein